MMDEHTPEYAAALKVIAGAMLAAHPKLVPATSEEEAYQRAWNDANDLLRDKLPGFGERPPTVEGKTL